jgi:hypothetical protein
MPGDSGVLVVTRVRSTTTKCTRGRGCNGHSGIPHALFGRKINARLGRIAPRDREVVFGIRVPSLRAKRSNPSSFLYAARWIASLRFARNDGSTRSDDSSALRNSLCRKVPTHATLSAVIVRSAVIASAAKQSILTFFARRDGLLRFARNDGSTRKVRAPRNLS